jgi:lipopolysaccharide export system permease protein
MILIMAIVVVFDFNEEIRHKFIQNRATAEAVIFDFYLNFIPYIGVRFSPLFVFISVIFFTSKMAYKQ